MKLREIIGILLLPFLIVYILTFILRRIASKLDIVDIPGRRKIHRRPIPLLGGLAIFTGVIAGLYFNSDVAKDALPLFLGATSILIVNLIDDIKGLSAHFRVIIESFIALLVIFSGVRVSFLPLGFWGDLGEVLITLIWLVGVTNAFNYLDGMDGLACGSAIINTFYFALILFKTHQFNLGALSVILMASCLGFLPHNFRKAKIFLGDAGSTFIGFMLAGIGILGNWAEDNIVKISIPVLILGVPIFDMVFTTIIRIKEGKVKTIIEWLRYGGKDHFHHYLVYLGLSPLGAVFFIWTVTFALGLSAVMLRNDRAWEGILTLAQASVIFAIIGVLIVIGRRKKSGWQAVDSS